MSQRLDPRMHEYCIPSAFWAQARPIQHPQYTGAAANQSRHSTIMVGRQCWECWNQVAPEGALECRAPAAHYTCNSCFTRHVHYQCVLRAAFVGAGCKVYCPYQGCAARRPAEPGAPDLHYTDVQIMEHADAATWAAFCRAREQLGMAPAGGEALPQAQQAPPPQQAQQPPQPPQQQQQEVAAWGFMAYGARLARYYIVPFFQRGQGQGQGQQVQCCVCLDDVVPSQGLVCRAPAAAHFMCNDCFSRSILVQCDVANPMAFVRAGCKVYCPQLACTAAQPPAEPGAADLHFTDRQIMEHADPATWAAYDNAKKQAHIAHGFNEAQMQQEQLRHPGGQQAEQQQEQQRQEALCRARNSIINTSLTLFPPCCYGGALMNWDGCFAVKCGYCPRHFCGFCCRYHGDKAGAHAHALQCRLRRPGAAAASGYYAVPGEKEEARGRLYTERLDAAFAQQQGEHGARFLADLLALMAADLRDVGLDPGRWMPQQLPPAEEQPGEQPQDPLLAQLLHEPGFMEEQAALLAAAQDEANARGLVRHNSQGRRQQLQAARWQQMRHTMQRLWLRRREQGRRGLQRGREVSRQAWRGACRLAGPYVEALAVQHPHLLFYATMAAAVLLTVLVLHMCLARGSSITHSLQSLPRVLGLSADARSFPSGIVTYISATVAGGVLLLLRALYAVLTALLLVWSCGAAVCTAFMQLVAWLAWQVISGVCCACVVGALVWRGERRGFCWVAVMCWAAVIARSM